jgi:hypothetical protein
LAQESSRAGRQTFATSVFDGIRVKGDQSGVRHNQLFNGAESGVVISGNNNIITDNVITEAAIGILKDTGSSGNIIAGNRFFVEGVWAEVKAGGEHLRLFSEHNALGVQTSVYDVNTRKWIAPSESVDDIRQGKEPTRKRFSSGPA